MFYRLVFEKKLKYASGLKIFLLIGGLLCDLATVFSLIFSILGNLWYIAIMFASILLGIILRVFALKLVYNVECKLQNEKLIISKIYPNKTKVVLSEDLENIKITPIDSKIEIDKIATTATNFIDLSVKVDELYMVQGQKFNVLCNLDRYIYASVLKGREI